MAVTKQQALSCREFHAEPCTKGPDGPRGGKGRVNIEVWRANGACKTWKTRPADFRLPVKYGFRGPYAYITNDNCEDFHVASECTVKEYRRMAKLSAYGRQEVARVQKTDNLGYRHQRALMSDDVVLEKHAQGSWKRRGKMKAGLTKDTWIDIYVNNGWEVVRG